MYLFGQGHFPHRPQLPPRPHPWWSSEADRRVRLSPEGTSPCAALHQTPPGQPDVSVTLLRLPKHAQEQVGMHQEVSEYTKSWEILAFLLRVT